MAIADVLRVFHALKQEGVIRDYLIFGSVAAMAHTRPFFTGDVDIAIVVESDAEFIRAFNKLAEFGKIEGLPSK
jgi:predicted nucleotidyltransferase